MGRWGWADGVAGRGVSSEGGRPRPFSGHTPGISLLCPGVGVHGSPGRPGCARSGDGDRGRRVVVAGGRPWGACPGQRHSCGRPGRGCSGGTWQRLVPWAAGTASVMQRSPRDDWPGPRGWRQHVFQRLYCGFGRRTRCSPAVYPVGERGKLVGTVMSAGRERRVVREPRLAAQGQGFAGAGAQQEGPPIFLGWDWGPRARKPEPSRIDT